MSISTSEGITLLEEANLATYTFSAGAALIFFDHGITFSQEVQLFWGERTFSACLFFANRMVALVYAVWSIMNFYAVTVQCLIPPRLHIRGLINILELYGKHRGDQCGSHTYRTNLKRGYNITSIRRDRWRPTICYAPCVDSGL
ncbi:uncharacterized protein LAESUDRAFT_434371 [Laetiporus sulphureus 93-53]|uniref:DUF6533 domain-containing protein n=1 Tax=Laetiporus sulphureus 93-53 TaxID=1314785 RepID=A0A165C660_9APHY|nr:uncharacterized protein LAESUDRAFT_434371 [Laetiporus sulphureus 93-53]KZT02271.1 hypothetical protein LAESUDRAFT_434371 [Laetiporus sulphureus 93-53]